jgi:glycerate kinase
MRVVVCLDKFRGSLTATEACTAVAAGLRAGNSGTDVVVVPIADGGEGTVEALVSAGYERRTAVVRGPMGAPVTAEFAVRDGLAVIEMAQASGLHLVSGQPEPLRASTFGTGELIARALDLGCRSIAVTAGGSATTDGGAGMLQALGARLLTAGGQPVEPGGGGLAALTEIDLGTVDSRIRDAVVVLASDVDNPLLGATGAAAVFGPQKGATADEVLVLEAGLQRLADVMQLAVGKDLRELAGAGAAGGLGFGVLAGLTARRVAGIDFIMKQTGIDAALDGAAMVVIGEGRLDEQSLSGKAPVGLAGLARRRGVPVVAVAGQVQLSAQQLSGIGVVASFAVLERTGDLATAISQAAPLLTAIGSELARLLGAPPRCNTDPEEPS